MHPGGIKTAFARNATGVEGLDHAELASLFEEQQAKTTPQRAAQLILDGVRRNKARVLVGPDVKALLVRAAGPNYERLLAGPVMGRVKEFVTRLLPKR